MNVRNATVALVAGATLMAAMTGAAHAQAMTAKKTKTSAASASAKRTTRRAALPPTAASRTRVSIDARNAPVQQALECLFRDAKAEYILDNTVEGTVNLKIVNQPFENALSLLLRASTTPLTYSRDGRVYVIRPIASRRTTPVVAATSPQGDDLITGDAATDGANNGIPITENGGLTAAVTPPRNLVAPNDYYDPYVTVNPANSPYYSAKVTEGLGFGTPPGLNFSPFGFNSGFANGATFSNNAVTSQSGGFYSLGNSFFYNPWRGGFLFGN